MVKGWNAASIAARREDLAWMAQHGESTEGAAERLGISRNGLYMWCFNNAPEVWHQLVINGEPRPARVLTGRIVYPHRSAS